MKILILDNERAQCEALAELLREQIRGRVQIDCVNTREEMSRRLAENAYSMIFMDIELGGELSGIDVAVEIREKYHSIRLIFITGHVKYCEEIFAAAPDALLLKPFNEENVSRTLDILRSRQEHSDSAVIAIGKRQTEKIPLDEVSYFETRARYLLVHDRDHRVAYRFYDVKMSDIADRLPEYFVWCHKSFFVNMDHVTGIERFRFRLDGGLEIPISQNRYKETKRRFLEYLEESL